MNRPNVVVTRASSSESNGGSGGGSTLIDRREQELLTLRRDYTGGVANAAEFDAFVDAWWGWGWFSGAD